MIKENVYYEVENEEEAKWIVDKMYEEGYKIGREYKDKIFPYYYKLYKNKLFIECKVQIGLVMQVIKVSTLMTPPLQSAYAHNINIETAECIIKKVSKYIINVYVKIDDKKKLIDSLNIDNPRLKDIFALYGIQLLDVRKLDMNDFMVEMAENRDVASVSVLFDNNKIEIYMKDGKVVKPIEMGIEVI